MGNTTPGSKGAMKVLEQGCAGCKWKIRWWCAGEGLQSQSPMWLKGNRRRGRSKAMRGDKTNNLRTWVDYLQSTEQKPLTTGLFQLSSSPSQRKGNFHSPADLSPRAPDRVAHKGTSADPKKASSSTGETSQHLASPGLLQGQIPSLGVTSRDTGLCAVPANTHRREMKPSLGVAGSAPA